MSKIRARGHRRTAIHMAAIGTVLLAACSPKSAHDGATPPPSAKPPAATRPPSNSTSVAALDYGEAPAPDAPITYQPGVVVVAGGSRAIRSVGADGLTFTIDGSAKGARDLAVGKIMLVTSRLVGRVIALERSGSDLTVSLGPALFSEVIRDARLSFDQQFKWDDIQRSGTHWGPSQEEVIPTARNSNPKEELISPGGARRLGVEHAMGASLVAPMPLAPMPAVYRSDDPAPRLLRVAAATTAQPGAGMSRDPGAGRDPSASQDPNTSQEPNASENPAAGASPNSTQDPGLSREPDSAPAPACNAQPSPVAQLGGPVFGGHSVLLDFNSLDVEVYWNTAGKPVTNANSQACGQTFGVSDSDEVGLRFLFNLLRSGGTGLPSSEKPGWLARTYNENNIKSGFGVKFSGKTIRLVGDLVIADGAIDLKQSTIEVTGIDSINLGLLAGADSTYAPRDKNQSATWEFQWPVTLGEFPFALLSVPMVFTASIKPAVQLSIGKNSTVWGHARYSISGPVGLDQGKPTAPSLQVQESMLDNLQGVTVTPIFITGTFEFKLMLGIGIKGFVNSGPYVKLRLATGVGRGSVLGLVVCRSANLEVDFGVGLGMSVNGNVFSGKATVKARRAWNEARGRLLGGVKEINKDVSLNSDIEFGETLRPVIGPLQSLSPNVPLCGA